MNLDSKIIYGLERLSEAFKSLLWEKAKIHGISPIQIQILLFVSGHKKEMCNISQIAKEFNVTKPTISDAVRVLISKDYLNKDFSSSDGRRYSLFLSVIGKKLVEDITEYTNPVKKELQKISVVEKKDLYRNLAKIISQLNHSGILQVQRTCFACKFYKQTKGTHYCNLLESTLKTEDVRLDCPEFEPKS